MCGLFSWGKESSESCVERWDRDIIIKKKEKVKRNGLVETTLTFSTWGGEEKIIIKNKKGIHGIMYMELLDQILESGIVYVPPE